MPITPPYVPTNWIEKQTAVGPTNLNHIEQALATLLGVAPATNGALVWDGTQFRADAKIKDANVDAAAAIATSKLALPADAKKVMDGAGSFVQVLRGQVTSTGAINFGTGFTITKGATGIYTINFSAAFAAAPVLVVTAIGAAGYADVTANSTTAATFTMVNTSGVAADIGFNFIAMTTA